MATQGPPVGEEPDAAVGDGGQPAWSASLLAFAKRLAGERPLVVLLVLGGALRALTMLAYRPALQYVQDSFDYLEDARRLAPGIIRPFGYPLFLALLSPFRQLSLVVLTQHALGMAMGVGLYLLLRRFGARAWLAALGAAPVLLDPYQVYLEQFIMSETVFEALTVSALGLLIWQERPSPERCAAVGGLLAVAALTRSVGLLVVAPAIGYVVLLRLGWRAVAAVSGAVVVVLALYASWFQTLHGEFALNGYSGYFLAGRVLPFADCDSLPLTAEQRSFCDDRPVEKRPGVDWYIWNPDSPLRRADFPPGVDRNEVAAGLARKVIRHQPADYLVSVVSDVVHYLSPGRSQRRGDNPVGAWQYRTEYTPQRWRPEFRPADPYVNQWTWPGATVSHNVVMAAHGFELSPIAPRLDRELAVPLRRYQRTLYVPGIALALAMVVAVLGGCARVRPERRHPRAAALLLAATGVVLVVGTAATSSFDYRYSVPLLTVAPPAGVLGAVLLIERWRERRSRAGSRAAVNPNPTSPAQASATAANHSSQPPGGVHSALPRNSTGPSSPTA